jgi:hypothetical protein
LPIIVFPPPLEGSQLPALTHLFALMVEPQDEAKRAAVEEALHAWVLLDCAEAGKLPEGVDVKEVARAARAMRFDELIASHERNFIDGGLAAEILLIVLGDAEKNPKSASLRRARERVERRLVEERLRGGKRTNMIELWNAYSPVAHLWAAHMVTGWAGSEFPCAPHDLPNFLAVAEHLRQRGESFYPYRRLTPILDPATTWRVGEGWALPKVSVDCASVLIDPGGIDPTH